MDDPVDSRPGRRTFLALAAAGAGDDAAGGDNGIAPGQVGKEGNDYFCCGTSASSCGLARGAFRNPDGSVVIVPQNDMAVRGDARPAPRPPTTTAGRHRRPAICQAGLTPRAGACIGLP